MAGLKIKALLAQDSHWGLVLVSLDTAVEFFHSYGPYLSPSFRYTFSKPLSLVTLLSPLVLFLHPFFFWRVKIRGQEFIWNEIWNETFSDDLFCEAAPVSGFCFEWDMENDREERVQHCPPNPCHTPCGWLTARLHSGRDVATASWPLSVLGPILWIWGSLDKAFFVSP